MYGYTCTAINTRDVIRSFHVSVCYLVFTYSHGVLVLRSGLSEDIQDALVLIVWNCIVFVPGLSSSRFRLGRNLSGQQMKWSREHYVCTCTLASVHTCKAKHSPPEIIDTLTALYVYM